VSAIRAEYALAGRRIAILGHSQGGMSMRWALRFWPDTRLLVDDVIGMAGTNHGSTAGWGCSATLRCPPAGWQQQATSQFIAALNSGAETFAGISYTEIFTHTDEVVQPNNTDADASSAVHTGAGLITNVATQDVCRLDVDEHFTIGTIDPAAYALVMDALTHPGPADPSRVNRAVCRQVFAPDVDPTQAKTALIVLAALGGIGAGDVPNATLLGIPKLPVEPSLRCYVFAAGC